MKNVWRTDRLPSAPSATGDAVGTPIRWIGYNPMLAVIGTILLPVDWIGFNALKTAGNPHLVYGAGTW